MELDPSSLDDLMDESAPTALADAITASPAAFKRRDDPSLPHYPRGLVLDIVLKTAPIPDLLTAYHVSTEQFKQLAQHPVFRQEIRDMRDKVKEEGFSFKVKAQAQAEAYLHEAWQMVHDPETPANVRSDLIKWTTKVAGLEPRPETTNNLAVNIDMRSLSNEELNARMMQIIMKKSPTPSNVTYDAAPVRTAD
jgi:hypothetical protein